MDKTRIVLNLVAVCLVLPMAAGAATLSQPDDWCGTHPTIDKIAAAQHDLFERQRAREPRVGARSGALLEPASRPEVSQQGDVVVVIDDGSIIRPPNDPDVESKGFRAQRKKKKGFKFTRKSASISGSLGQRLVLGDDDSVFVPFEKGFKFNFFGTAYTGMWVNSDGNITFGEGDSASTARDLGRALNGPARIMAFFTDLDPSVAGDVYVKFLGKGKMQVTWEDVPIFGGLAPNTFQVTLFRKGHLEFRFREIDAATGIIGFSPGGGAAVRLLDFTDDVPATVAPQAIAEVFSDEESVDETLLAQVYYDHYPDDVHQIVLFYDFPLPLLGGQAIAYHFTIKNDVKGIGYKHRREREIFDNSPSLGSNGVLEGFANMGYAGRYRNPNSLSGTIDKVGIFVHEIGHQWLLRLRFKKKGGPTNGDLQENGGHWAFTTDTDASFMQGNEIRDNGDGTFTTLEKDAEFNPVDLYVLGMIPPEEVPDFFYVSGSGEPADQLPAFFRSFGGERVDVSIEDVIREEGPRVPDSDSARKTERLAVVLLVRQGSAPQFVDEVQKMINLTGKEWKQQTGGGSFDFEVAPF